ncbi:MAG: helix-turn-helix domain-containing protein [Paracoccaceae bacterium]
MTVDPGFLRDVQNAGWLIRSVGQGEVFGMCPRAGCDVVLQFRAGSNVPATCRPVPEFKETIVNGFEDARRHLRKKRERLCVTIAETEDVAGMAVDYMAKFEKDEPSKIPNAQTFFDWCKAMGVEVVLRDGNFPATMLNMISQTRQYLKARRVMQPHHQARRLEKMRSRKASGGQ